MTFSYQDLISIQEVIADAALELDDKAMRKLTPGWYRKSTKRAMDELSFDVPFVDITRDIIMPDDLKVEIPKGFYDISNIHIFTGTPDNVGYVENVYWKRNFETRGRVYRAGALADAGYTANNHEYNITDPFFKVSRLYQTPNNAYYFNTHSGFIHLSDACNAYAYVRIGGKGIATAELDIDKIKIIPPFALKAVTLWVVEKGARALKATDTGIRRYRTIQNDASSQLDEYGMGGAWHEAKVRLGKIDTKKWRDFIEYNSKMTY
jgi:hypothetical protein